MAIHIHTYTPDTLPMYVAEGMAPLTKVGSQFAKWILAATHGERAENTPDELVWAVACREQDFEITVLGWVSVHPDPQRGYPILAGFVAGDERRKHLATILAGTALMAAGVSRDAIGAHGPYLARIANNLGFRMIGTYKPVEDGWVVNWSSNQDATLSAVNDEEE